MPRDKTLHLCQEIWIYRSPLFRTWLKMIIIETMHNRNNSISYVYIAFNWPRNSRYLAFLNRIYFLLLCTEALSCWKKKSFQTFNIINDRTIFFKNLIDSFDQNFSSIVEKDKTISSTIIHTMTSPYWHCLLHLAACLWCCT